MRPIGLCVIADPDAAQPLGPGQPLGPRAVELAEAACRGGAGMVQLRHKGAGAGELLAEAEAVARACRGTGPGAGVLFIVNDRLDVALAAGAAGVHLGQDDLPGARARGLIGRRILGISTHTRDQALAAVAAGADYIGVGPIFATRTKETGYAPLGLEGLRAIRESVAIPIVAIGGIGIENAEAVAAAGADGLAVISAAVGAPDVAEACRALAAAIARGHRARRQPRAG